VTRRRAERERVEAALPPEVLVGVRALLGALGLPADAWPLHPGLAPAVESAAVMTLAKEEQLSNARACALLGVEQEAHDSRRVRWWRAWMLGKRRHLVTCAEQSTKRDWGTTQRKAA
jgi:hypothetical protein